MHLPFSVQCSHFPYQPAFSVSSSASFSSFDKQPPLLLGVSKAMLPVRYFFSVRSYFLCVSCFCKGHMSDTTFRRILPPSAFGNIIRFRTVVSVCLWIHPIEGKRRSDGDCCASVLLLDGYNVCLFLCWLTCPCVVCTV